LARLGDRRCRKRRPSDRLVGVPVHCLDSKPTGRIRPRPGCCNSGRPELSPTLSTSSRGEACRSIPRSGLEAVLASVVGAVEGL
jgi:hypothetical protein